MTRQVTPPTPEYLKFLSAYEPRITELALAVRAMVLQEAPEATELIYDAYNAVAAGYSFTGRPSDAFLHIAAYAHWVNLGFNRGSLLQDPDAVLQGAGKWIRHIKIAKLEDLMPGHVRALVKAAIAGADRGVDEKGKSVVRAVYKNKRRPMRHAT